MASWRTMRAGRTLMAPGTVIFACEFVIQELTGEAFERGLDEQTGLPLWPMPD